MHKTLEKLHFLNNNSRHQAVFLMLLREDGYLTSDYLSNKLDVTSRTIKSDIAQIRESLDNLDISIDSVPSKGYRLCIEDKVLENDLKSHYRIFSTRRIEDEFEHRIEFILKYLLTAQDYVTVNEIQRSMYVNESNPLSEELEYVRTLLDYYGLELESRPRYGLKVNGENFRKFMILVRLYKVFDNTTASPSGLSRYDDLFFEDEAVEQLMREIFINNLMESEIVLADIYLERLLVYLNFFNINEDYINLEFQNNYALFDYSITREYKFINNVLLDLQEKGILTGISEEVKEFLYFICIISTDTYRYRECNPNNYGRILLEADKIVMSVTKHFENELSINVIRDYTTYKDLIKTFIPIVLKIEYNISDDIDLGFYNENYIDSVLTIKHYMLKMQEFVRDEYSYILSIREMNLLFDIVRGHFNRIILPTKKLKLAMVAINGRLATQQIKFNLKNHFDDQIECIETNSLYYFENQNEKKYDYYLMSDFGKQMNIKVHPIYYAKETMNEMEYVESLSKIFVNSYNLDDILPSLKTKEVSDLKINFDTTNYTLMQDYLDKNIYLNLHSEKERFMIYYTNELRDYLMIIDTNINGNQQKLKALFKVVDKMMTQETLKGQNIKDATYTNLF